MEKEFQQIYKEDKNSALQYGSVISLQHLYQEKDFLYVEGFINLLPSFLRLDNPIATQKYNLCLFQILPSFINTFKKPEMQKTKKSKMENSKSIEDKQKIANEYKVKISQEFKLNLETFDKQKKQTIQFGQQVQFLHLQSNKYLESRNLPARIEKENFKLQLVEYTSDATIFKIMPYFQHQMVSKGQIHANDIVYVVSANSDFRNKIPYLHASLPAQIDGPVGGDAKFSSQTEEIEVNVSLEKRTKLRIKEFQKVIMNDKLKEILQCGDVIWLSHSEYGATLTGVQRFDEDYSNSNNRFSSKLESESWLVDLTQQMVSEKSGGNGNTNGLWLIQNEDFIKGGLVKTSGTYRLRHYTTGLFLSAIRQKRIDPLDPKYYYKLQLQRDETQNSKIQFRQVNFSTDEDSIPDSVITKGGFLMIQFVESKMWIRVGIQTAGGNDKNVERMKLSLSENITEQDVFKIYQANYNEIWEINFLISCIPMLKKYLILQRNYNISVIIFPKDSMEPKDRRVAKKLN